jgi:hypothetical protein
MLFCAAPKSLKSYVHALLLSFAHYSRFYGGVSVSKISM